MWPVGAALRSSKGKVREVEECLPGPCLWRARHAVFIRMASRLPRPPPPRPAPPTWGELAQLGMGGPHPGTPLSPLIRELFVCTVGLECSTGQVRLSAGTPHSRATSCSPPAEIGLELSCRKALAQHEGALGGRWTYIVRQVPFVAPQGG